jgi:hypothetical protein
LGARRSIVAAVVVAGWLATGCAGSSESGVTGAGGNPDASATGVAGRGGGSGAAGTTGAAGRGGTTGAAGTSGAAGTTGAAGRGGATGTAGTTGGAGTAGASALPDLGKACAANTDCTGGTTCLTAASKIIVGAEGPANGYCSKACTADADCSSGGICLDVSAAGAPAQGYCFQTCTFGGAAGSSKCHGRTDVGCLTIQAADATTTPATPQVDICYPACSQDSDCPAGRKCDLGNALCADTVPAGDPVGSHCATNADAGTSNCAGGCLPIGSAAGGTAVAANVCTNYCVVGNLNACNWVGAGTSLMSGGGAHGVCALADPNAQVGDMGFCSQECDTAADCSDKVDPGATCDTSAMSTIGHGICSWG